MEMTIKFNPTERKEVIEVLLNSKKFRQTIEYAVEREMTRMRLDKTFLVSLSHHLLKEIAKQTGDDKT